MPRVSTIQKVRADINPQLCKVYNPAKHDWTRPWIVEPKLDGLRCNITCEPMKANGVGAYSRNGKPLWNMLNILCEAADCNRRTPELMNGFVLDGEVYTKDWNLSMSIVKRSTKTHPDSDKLRYHVFDCLTLKEWKAGTSKVSNQDRKKRLSPWLTSKYIQIVEGVSVNCHAELEKVYQDLLVKGYEGAILKNPEGIYEKGRRSPHWLKIKPWTDADLTVIGSYPGEGKHLGRIGGLVLEGEAEWNGNSYSVHTEVGTGFTDEERISFQLLADNNELIGRIVEIKFQDITVDGSCRFPVYSRLREDKE